jgi:hypothetical protein
VFQRYLATIDGRVRGLGGNPDLIGPSPTGNVPDGALPTPPGTPGVDSFGLIDKCCKEVARALRATLWLLVPTLVLLVILLLILILRA